MNTTMLAPLTSVNNDRRFSWLRNFFFNPFQDWLNSDQQSQGNFTKDADQKMKIKNKNNRLKLIFDWKHSSIFK